MNSAAELKRHNDMSALQKSKDRVIEALNNDPFGLRIEQIMSICRISAKTAKNVLACIDTENDDGVYTLKNMAKPVIDASPEVEVKKEESQVEHIEIPVEINRCDIQSELLKLLEESKGGLLSSEIMATLDITEKQFSNALWTLRKTQNVKRTGKSGSFHYRLINDEDVQLDNSKPLDPVVEVDTAKDEKEWKAFCDMPVNRPPIEVDPLNVCRAKITTVVTRKSELKIETDQLLKLMTNLFGLSNVEWFVEAGRLVGVYMSEEQTA